MKTKHLVAAALLALAATAVPARAQVGKSLGVVDANTAPEKDLLAMPHMTPAIVKGLIEKRPFASITDLNAYLLSQQLTQDQANAFYGKAFVHINLNTATAAEILLVPGAGKRMAHEFEEYRPWKSVRAVRQRDRKVCRRDEDRATGSVHVHPGEAEYGDRRRHPVDPRRRAAHGARVQGVPALEDEGAVHQGDRQVRWCQGGRADVALCDY